MRRFALLSAAVLSCAGGAAAQTARGIPAPPGPAAAIEAGDRAHAALRPREALEAFTRLLASRPDHYEALWRAAREEVNLGMLAPGGEERKTHYAAAETWARRARAARPQGVEGAEWLAIALGRQALEQGPRARVRYAVEIRETADAALALDSTNAGAHHVLGEWHAEIRRLSGPERWIARRLLGGAVLEDATWEAAEHHLRLAATLNPAGLVHHLDLARTYRDTGRPEEAREHLRQVLERPSVEPVDPLHKQAAQEILRRLPDVPEAVAPVSG